MAIARREPSDVLPAVAVRRGGGILLASGVGRWIRWESLHEVTRRLFDVLTCPRCGGRMRVISTIEDPVVIRKILTHLGLLTEVPAPRPPPHDLFGWS